jgi:hypothetical protein
MPKETVDIETGEVMTGAAVVPYDPRAYLATLTKHDGLAVQKELASAYDAACAALIGPNDVQHAEGRTFKKKSAWRKLARYFNISVEIVKVDNSMQGDEFLSTVTARAVAPWGQRYEEVGACCTDEATGRRVISIADAIATASTRASNRAVSNLIAMGEVSAEEIGDRTPRDAAPRRDDGVPRLPFGKSKGTPLADLDDTALRGARDWAVSKGKFADFVKQANIELDRRGEPVGVAADGDDGDDASGLPF